MEHKHINWRANARLMHLKTLAWAIKKHERVNEVGLWRRTGELCRVAMERLIGEYEVTLQSICEETKAMQGADITPHKLLQRADKVERYMEVGQLLMDKVEAVYLALVKEVRTTILEGDPATGAIWKAYDVTR